MRKWLVFALLLAAPQAEADAKARAYAMQALVVSFMGPKLCPQFLTNVPVTRAAVHKGELDVGDAETRDDLIRHAYALEKRHGELGSKASCELIWTDWGKRGAVIPGVLLRR